MFTGITEQRFTNMSKQEQRWFDNVKKAFHRSDQSMESGQPEDECLAELFKAVDTAKKLRRSLRGENTSNSNNRKQFIEFLGLEIPSAQPGQPELELYDKRTGELRKLTLGEIIYEIRCMIHENENLNIEEDIDYHILLDWSHRNPIYPAYVSNKIFVFNGFFIWNRLREVIAKFITVIDAYNAMANNENGCITINPELGSIKPTRRQREE